MFGYPCWRYQACEDWALKIYDSIGRDNESQRVTKNTFHKESELSTTALNELLVGREEEIKTITNRLTRGSKHLDIVSVVGMAGLGKTTLANEIYHHPSILNHFHTRSWCTVSHVYSKQNLLVQILCGLHSRSPDQYLKVNEDDLVENLKRALLRNRYLIVLDDGWDINAFNLLEPSLPDDANGSRILFTSRFQNLTLQSKPDNEPYHLHRLTDEECFGLLQRKIFSKEDCPPAQIEVLMQIANKCKGLPFTVVIVAGILSNIETDHWQAFANSLSSSTVIETNPLELGYNYLHDDLKPLLLYIGAFSEDLSSTENISVLRLLWLWISEGLVRKTEGKSLEELAEEFLKALVDQSLVMVTQQRTIGGAKACRVHDLVHEFCVAKAKEENFLQIFHGIMIFVLLLCPTMLAEYLFTIPR